MGGLELVYALVSIVVFPGVLFLVALSLFTEYMVRKISARYQRRMGPSYVGPFGILQPFFDLLKLVRVKEIVVSRYGMYRAAEVMLLIGIAFIAGSVVLLPLSLYNVIGEFDLLVFFYMSSVMPLFMLILASLSMPSPYTVIGVSRLLSIITIAEPAYFASLVIPAYLATRNAHPFMSIAVAYANVPALWLNPLTALIMLLSVIAFVVSVQAKSMLQPFNIPEAEQEIIAGFETEFSGPVLGLARLLHDLDIAVTLIVGAYLLLGGPAPFRHLSIEGVLLLVIKYLALLLVIVTIRNIMGRYRIEQALVQLFKYGLVPSLVATGLALTLGPMA
uniref:NADH-quinone oxidoreductase subunit H n=1 Tax=Ignisphaera aggregans TaxID=334771 RepID=A0A7C2ZNK8_9CREN